MKEEAGEVVVEVAAEEEDYFRVRVMALVLGRVEAKDTVREKAMECSVEAAVEEVVVEVEVVVELGLGLVPDSDRGAAQGLEEEAEAEVAGVEEEAEAEEEEEKAGAEAEVPLGVAPSLVQDTGPAMAPDAEDGKRFRGENKSSIEISVSLGHIL